MYLGLLICVIGAIFGLVQPTIGTAPVHPENAFNSLQEYLMIAREMRELFMG